MINMVQLSVVSGLQTGAKMSLNLDQSYSLGATIEHDIVFRHLHTSGVKLVPAINGLRVFIRDASDTEKACVNGVPVSDTGSGVLVPYGQRLQLGDTTLLFEYESPRSDDLANRIQSTEPSPRANFATRLLRVGGLSVIGFVLLGMVSSYNHNSQKSENNNIAALESRLAQANFADLSVNRDDGKIFMVGYVATRDQAMQVANFIAQQPEPIINRVLVDEEIRDHIKDVLRINGVSGSIDSMGQGEFVANTRISSPEKLASLQSLIKKDVPSARSFKLINEPPPQPQPVAKQTSPELDAGKRVVMVNSDSPAYVVTEDHSRYFVGSTLPGGYRISAITNGRVTVEKQGVKTELKF